MIPPNVSPHLPPWPISALIVDPNDLDVVSAVSALTAAGFTVSVTDNYRDAKALLVTHPPLVVVTEVRLGAFNGVQLALHAAYMTPRVTVVVVSGVYDPVLQRDAERAGATFAVKPLTSEELLAAICRMALRRRNPDGAFEPIRAPFERRQGERRQTVAAHVKVERRQSHRRSDIASLLRRAASLS